jgi:protein-S-isoprenylcysteine O-methyltransferase Ste14
MKSWLLVIIQFVCLGGIVLTGPLLARGLWIIPQAAGAALGLWALWTMQIRRLNILPDVRDDAELVQHGPYRYIRHPMYAGLVLMTGAMLIADFSTLRLLFWLALLANFEVKLRYEETLLRRRFPEYEAYAESTNRLVPGIY